MPRMNGVLFMTSVQSVSGFSAGCVWARSQHRLLHTEMEGPGGTLSRGGAPGPVLTWVSWFSGKLPLVLHALD